MRTAKIAISVDQALLKRLDQLVSQKLFPSRSAAVQSAIQEKLSRLEQNRLATECQKLDPDFERALAEEGFGEELTSWPAY